MGNQIYDDSIEPILREAFDLVGFSAQHTTYPVVIQIAKKIKIQRPDVKMVVGGHNAYFADRLTLDRLPQTTSLTGGRRRHAASIAAS
jgi:hypothetical protein